VEIYVATAEDTVLAKLEWAAMGGPIGRLLTRRPCWRWVGRHSTGSTLTGGLTYSGWWSCWSGRGRVTRSVAVVGDGVNLAAVLGHLELGHVAQTKNCDSTIRVLRWTNESLKRATPTA